MVQKVLVLGVGLSPVTMHEAITLIEERLKRGERSFVVTPNPEIVMAARANPVYRRTLNQATLALPDGFGVTLAARLFGHRLPERIAGIDFLNALCARRHSVFLLGALPGVALAAGRALEHAYPGISIRGAMDGGDWDPRTGELADESVFDAIRAATPTVLAVALGHPKQEQWIWDHWDRLSEAAVVIGVGGSLDYVSGATRRAPLWMRRAGLEWFYRLLRQPNRIGRIVTATVTFTFTVLRERLRMRPDTNERNNAE